MENKSREEALGDLKKFTETLTQKEIDDPSYFDWPDEKLGAFCRVTAQYLKTKTIKGYEPIMAMAAIHILITCCKEANAGVFKVDLKNVTSEAFPDPSDWRITVKKIEPK